ncbi:MAG: ATP-binding protein [Pyrinomonadaceae bacterium]
MNRRAIQILGVISLLAAALLVYKLGGWTGALLFTLAVLGGAALVGSLRLDRTMREADTLPDRGPSLSSEPRNKQSLTIPPAELLEATLNSMREGVLVVGPDTRIVASNAAARALFDANLAKLETQRLIDITRQPLIHEAFRNALETGERGEVTVVAQSSERRTFELRVAPLRFGRGEAERGAIGVFFDITRLEALERTRQEFLSNVSHELRTPLTAIIAFVETLEDGAIDDPENNWKFLDIIRKNAGRMQELIEDILDLSSIEAGNVTLELRQVRLASVVDDVFASLNGRANARQIILANEVDAVLRVQADQRRLEQMLTNLIDNAIKFNREGGTVTVSCSNGDDERLRIVVTDTGEGIPTEQLPRIFERFYRVDRARSRELGGSGLGLAIVKHLARAHGGEATVQSAPGTGSMFTIELPRASEG